jgi:hypothetical protein
VIKLTNFERDPQNPDNVIATIEYDINGVDQAPFNIDAPMATIEPLTIDQIKDFVKGQVATQRGDALWAAVQGKLNPIKNVDLEAP